MSIVTASNLIKNYNSFAAVDGIDFEIRTGECFGFLGPNGAGKTTAMSIIYCYMPPSSGDIRVMGMDVNEHPSDIKARTGVMPQDNNLDPDLSTLENLVAYAKYFGIPRKKSLPVALELLEFTGLSAKADQNIKELSGGMQRRLVLARSLINSPEILILDEPTNGLDPHSRRSVWSQINKLKSDNITIILTTHYMEEAEMLCDRVAIMDSGRIVVTDSPANLVSRYGGNLEAVYLRLTGRSLTE